MRSPTAIECAMRRLPPASETHDSPGAFDARRRSRLCLFFGLARSVVEKRHGARSGNVRWSALGASVRAVAEGSRGLIDDGKPARCHMRTIAFACAAFAALAVASPASAQLSTGMTRASRVLVILRRHESVSVSVTRTTDGAP